MIKIIKIIKIIEMINMIKMIKMIKSTRVYNKVSGYQFNCCLPSIRFVVSGVIDPKPSLSCENEGFLEKSSSLGSY